MLKQCEKCSGCYVHILPHGIIGTHLSTHPEPQRFINSSVDLLPHGYQGTYLGHLAIYTDLQVISRRILLRAGSEVALLPRGRTALL